MMNYTVLKAKILTNSSIEITNASLFEILYNVSEIGAFSIEFKQRVYYCPGSPECGLHP